MTKRNEISFNAVFYQEGPCWIGQVLEHDITVQAKALPDLKGCLLAKVTAEIAICKDLGEKTLGAIGPAPKRFWDMFHEASMTVSANPEIAVADRNNSSPHIVPNIRIGMRLISVRRRQILRWPTPGLATALSVRPSPAWWASQISPPVP